MSERRIKSFSFRISCEEFEALALLAKLRGLPKSSTLRSLFLKEANRMGLWRPCSSGARDPLKLHSKENNDDSSV